MEDKSIIKLRESMKKIEKQVCKMSDELILYTIEQACRELELRSKQYSKPNSERLKRFQDKRWSL